MFADALDGAGITRAGSHADVSACQSVARRVIRRVFVHCLFPRCVIDMRSLICFLPDGVRNVGIKVLGIIVLIDEIDTTSFDSLSNPNSRSPGYYIGGCGILDCSAWFIELKDL